MKNTEKSYENLVNLLKNSKPHLEQAEDLRKNIIKRIEYQSANRQKMTIYCFTGIISGVAACLLGILFLYETTRTQMDYSIEYQSVNKKYSLMTDFAQSTSYHPTNNVEDLKIIASIIQQRQIENKKREQFLNNYQLRITNYECFKHFIYSNLQ
jgi:hypothetical protein